MLASRPLFSRTPTWPSRVVIWALVVVPLLFALAGVIESLGGAHREPTRCDPTGRPMT